MACAKPVIASEIGGIPETMDFGKAGLLFKPGDVAGLANSINSLYQNYDNIRNGRAN